jgi:hypothetical protein
MPQFAHRVNSERNKQSMSKRGSPVLRHSLWSAAVSVGRFLKEYYDEYSDLKRPL